MSTIKPDPNNHPGYTLSPEQAQQRLEVMEQYSLELGKQHKDLVEFSKNQATAITLLVEIADRINACVGDFNNLTENVETGALIEGPVEHAELHPLVETVTALAVAVGPYIQLAINQHTHSVDTVTVGLAQLSVEKTNLNAGLAQLRTAMGTGLQLVKH